MFSSKPSRKGFLAPPPFFFNLGSPRFRLKLIWNVKKKFKNKNIKIIYTCVVSVFLIVCISTSQSSICVDKPIYDLHQSANSYTHTVLKFEFYIHTLYIIYIYVLPVSQFLTIQCTVYTVQWHFFINLSI